MKKIFCITAVLAVMFTVCSCGAGGSSRNGRSGIKSNTGSVADTIKERIEGGKATEEPKSGSFRSDDLSSYGKKIDIDVTKMGSTMTYSQVSNFMTNADDYIGKVVKIKGNFTYGVGDDRYYFACIIQDATACCSQGIEFILKNGRQFPEEYPAVGDEITLVGVFDTYNEGKYQYIQLIDAYIEK